MARQAHLSLLEQLNAGEDLSHDAAMALGDCFADIALAPDIKKQLLIALSDKGESAVEVAGLAETFRGLAVDPKLGALTEKAIDIVGTGGDGFGSFNISTTASLIVAAAGVPVTKHGNRSITSKCGSADFLEALGVDLEADLAQQKRALETLNFCFFFAPNYHPAFKSIGLVRKALAAEGRRSVFNLLGPLINPARPPYQLMGVYDDAWVLPLAAALEQLSVSCALVVHCQLPDDSGIDELSTAGKNHIAGAGELSHIEVQWHAADIMLPGCDAAQLKGGDVTDNLKLLASLMNGSAPVGLEDTVCLNAGAALWVAGRDGTLNDGIEHARDILTEGGLQSWLAKLKPFYQS